MTKPCLIVGIAGGTGSGKSTLARRIAQAFRPDALLVCHDNYYRSHDALSFAERAGLNYDHPDALETELLVRHLDGLRAGRAAEAPVYDFTRHLRSEETLRLTPSPLIVVEGMLVLADENLRRRFDLKIFVDTGEAERLRRRMKRDMEERGRSADSVLAQYAATVRPMHEQFVAPSRRWADIVVKEGGYNEKALAMIVETLSGRLAGRS